MRRCLTAGLKLAAMMASALPRGAWRSYRFGVRRLGAAVGGPVVRYQTQLDSVRSLDHAPREA